MLKEGRDERYLLLSLVNFQWKRATVLSDERILKTKVKEGNEREGTFCPLIFQKRRVLG